MKRRVSICILCLFIGFLCVACGNADLKEEINVVDITTAEGNEADLYAGEYNSYDTTVDAEEKLSTSAQAEDNLIVNELEKLVGEYEYLSDYGTGRLIIQESDYGYDISDYESQSSYRFFANSSNIEKIENSRIYVKYPEQVFQDDTVVFSYYILEYSAEEIDVYYRQSEQAEEQFLYHATKKKEDLLDLFINGSIDAIDSTDLTSTFHIADFNMDSEEWDSYSIGERVDLDNDGEDEQIICGPYGGIYLDARDGKVYEFAMGDGNANVLSYTYYNGEIWIMYSNGMNAGYEAYYMEKYEGAGNRVAEMSFGAELIDGNNAESGMKYLLNGNEISYDEYTAFCSKIFAAEVSTN
ncbi:MAG: hypothetical protein J6A94_04245 [Lachnospiraceae bacterium]|nr:hypothetical protein [Lachnospiraceae bacterium]